MEARDPNGNPRFTNNTDGGSTVINTGATGAEGTCECAPPAGSSYQSPQDNTQAPNPIEALFFSQVNAAANDIVLTQEGEDYLNNLKKYLGEEGCVVERIPNSGAYYVMPKDGKGLGIGLAFSECIRKDSSRPFTPYTMSFDRIFSDIDKVIKKTAPIYAVLVTPLDYSRPRSMARQMANTIRYTLTDTATLMSLEAGKFRMIRDMKRASDYIARQCPHSVVPYYQYSLIVDITEKAKYRSRNPLCDDRDDEHRWVPFFAVGAYTDFFFDPDALYRNKPPFVPVVTISTVSAQFSAVQLFPMIIAACYEEFIKNRTFIKPFMIPGSPLNLSKLIPDSKNPTMAFRGFDTVDMLNRCANDILSEPIMAIDVTSGRLDYPGFSLLTDDNGMRKLINVIHDAVGTDSEGNSRIGDIPRDLVLNGTQVYTGTVKVDGDVMDSRTIDYFWVLNHQPNVNIDLARQLMIYNGKPDHKFMTLQELGFNDMNIPGTDSLQSLYGTQKLILNPRALDSIMSIASRLDVMFTGESAPDSIFNLDRLRDTGTYLYDTYGNRSVFGGGYNGDGSYRSMRMGSWFGRY